MNLSEVINQQIQFCLKEFSNYGKLIDTWGRVITPEHVSSYLINHSKLYEKIVHIIIKLLPETKNTTIFEIGAAYGVTLLSLKQLGYNVNASDLDECINIYCRHLLAHNINVTPWNLHIEDKPNTLGEYDIVISSEVIEHLMISSDSIIRKKSEILKPNGYMIITTPNLYRISNIFKICKGDNIIEPFPDIAKFINNVIFDTRVHPRELTMKEIISSCKKNGLNIIYSHFYSNSSGYSINNILYSLIPEFFLPTIFIVARKNQS